MAQTVAANGLTVSHKGTSGLETCSAPDVCKTPVGNSVVPVPYVIVSKSSDLVRGTTSVFADGGNSIDHKSSAHSRCTGDEAGTLKGVTSGTNMHESTWITFSPNVYVEGKNISRLSDKMFMNNKNTISGVGGHYEVPASISDPIMKELCKIFCAAREEWLDNKKKGKTSPKPSKIAEGKVDDALKKGGGLSKAVKSKFPKGFGAAEKAFFAPADDLFKGARKMYDQSAVKRALKRQVQKLVRRKVVQKGVSMGARAWTKLVPGLNVITTIYDVVDVGITAYDIYKQIDAASVMDKAVKVKPDFSVHDADGAAKEIYDFKFDDPNTGYQDDWQHKQKQHEAYKKATGKDPKKVDNATCKCDAGKKTPSVPSM